MALVLIVDDEAPIADLLTELLEEYGHTVLQAENGVDALQLACQHHPALIITDVMMPIMDGHELLKAVRTDPELCATAVVLISAGATCFQATANILQANACLRKPFELSAVEDMLERLVPVQAVI